MRPLLAALCLLLALLAYVEADHECGHVPPQRIGYSTTTSTRSKRQATERQPIRITPVYYEDDFNQLTVDQRAKYTMVAERAISYLSSFLKVDRLTQNITLQRYCNISMRHSSSNINPYDHCIPEQPCEPTYCFHPNYTIPEEHLKACKTCDSYGSTNCSTDGEDGPGVADTDFVVYVAARSLACHGSALAYATYCVLDKSTDRPIAGLVNLCPSLKTSTDIENDVLVVTHELTHALVFSPHLMAYYRDRNGNPRTPRNETTGLPALGPSSVFTFQPSADTILQETVQREALNGVYDIDVNKLVTPAVLREARRHFDCPTLNGMELENIGGSGTKNFHWKKRLVENEGMTGVISTNGVFSRLTYALYEDSGWYDVDYSVASPLRFGQCLGCDFAEKSCYSYGLDNKPFCNVQQFLTFNLLGGPLGGANISCSYDRVAIAYCSLVDLSLLPLNISIPIQYQYYDNPNLGGLESTIDYCPVPTVFAHCQRPVPLGSNVFLQSFSSNSKCVDFEIRTNWTAAAVNGTIPPIHSGGCFEVSCASEGSVTITIGNTTILCQSAGQEIIVPAGGFDMTIICPAFEDICWENSTTCPATTSAPPPSSSGVDGVALAIGLIFGVFFPLAVGIAVAVLVVLLVMRSRGGGNSSTWAKQEEKKPPVSLEAYSPASKGSTSEEKA